MSGLAKLYATTVSGERRLTFDAADRATQHVDPAGLFDGRALFSQVVVGPMAGRPVWISGLIGCDADNHLVSARKEAQIAQAFVNLRIAMQAIGLAPDDVGRITEYVVDYVEQDLIAIRAGIESVFMERRPANVLVPVPRLGRDGAWFEIEASGTIQTYER